MSALKITGVLVGVVIFIFLYVSALTDGDPIKWLWYRLFPGLKRKRDKREEEEAQKNRLREQEEEQRGILYRLGEEVKKVFAVDLGTIHENTTQDEVVRVVNLLAYKTAVACVNEDKIVHGEKVEPSHHPEDNTINRDTPWGEITAKRKIEWANTRKLALQICPELAEQMPHFSEFEPLKSYREEHLLEKRAKPTT